MQIDKVYERSRSPFTRLEVAELEALRPPCIEESAEARALRNGRLRARLSFASDYAVAIAAERMGNLATRELLKRLEGERYIPLEPLVKITDNNCTFGFQSKAGRRWIELVTANVARYTPHAPMQEIAEVAGRFAGSIVERDTDVLDEMFSWRDDIDTIIRVLCTDPSKAVYSNKLENIRMRAKILRENRKI